MNDLLEYDFTSIDYMTKDVLPLYESITRDGKPTIKINVNLSEQ